MTERGSTNLLFVIGIGLIILAAAVYGVLTLLGIGAAVSDASQETGVPVFMILLVPGLVFFGFLLMVIKVVSDRLGSKDDDHYTKNVDN